MMEYIGALWVKTTNTHVQLFHVTTAIIGRKRDNDADI